MSIDSADLRCIFLGILVGASLLETETAGTAKKYLDATGYSYKVIIIKALDPIGILRGKKMELR